MEKENLAFSLRFPNKESKKNAEEFAKKYGFESTNKYIVEAIRYFNIHSKWNFCPRIPLCRGKGDDLQKQVLIRCKKCKSEFEENGELRKAVRIDREGNENLIRSTRYGCFWEPIAFPLYHKKIIHPIENQYEILFFRNYLEDLEDDTNMLSDGCLPIPQEYDLLGISAIIFGNPNEQDLHILEEAKIDLVIYHKTYFQMPLISITHKGLNLKKLAEIYKKLQKKVKGLSKEEISASVKGINQQMPLKLKNSTIIRLHSQEEFMVRLSLPEKLSKKVKVAMVFHGVLYRPVL